MWNLLGLIPGLFGTINGITNAIANERLAKISAKTQEEKIQADENINTLQARRDVMIARSGKSYDALMAFLMAIPVLAIDFKLLLIDKVVGSLLGCAGPIGQAIECRFFRTDPLSTEQWAYIAAVHAFYFLYIAVRK